MVFLSLFVSILRLSSSGFATEKNTYFFVFPSGYFYRPQRSCGQGNVFTGVCLSTGGCLPQCMLGCHGPPGSGRHPPWDQGDPPGTRQTPLGPGRPPGTRQTPPWDQADTTPPPGKQTPAYGLRAAGTHPTGMHSCQNYFFHRFKITSVARVTPCVTDLQSTSSHVTRTIYISKKIPCMMMLFSTELLLLKRTHYLLAEKNSCLGLWPKHQTSLLRSLL